MVESNASTTGNAIQTPNVTKKTTKSTINFGSADPTVSPGRKAAPNHADEDWDHVGA